MKPLVALLAPVACLVLAGCGKGPEPEQPEFPEPPLSMLIESVRVKVDAEQPAAIEADLAADTRYAGENGSIALYSGTDSGKWEFARSDGKKIGGGSNHIEAMTEPNPVFSLLPVTTQIIARQRWVFVRDNGDEQEFFVYFSRRESKPVTRSRESGVRWAIWFYEDLTEYYKKKYPEAGVRGVVRVQISNKNKRSR